MQSFLEKLSAEIIKKHPEELGEVSIVLPSRRAVVFLNYQFQQQIKQNSWLPKIFSLEDFIVSLGDFTILDQIDLIFELYSIHKKVEGKNAESLEDFMSWGGILLQDFNEVDRYLVDPKKLYNYLTEAKEIESWNLEAAELSDFQKKYLYFWKSLGQYYQLFTEQLLSEKKAYQGLAFRKIAESLESKQLQFEEDTHLYFAGFNALTKSEQKIIDALVDQKGAKIYWDADKYYLENPIQEAGKFLRIHQKREKEFNWVFDNLLQDSKEINIYGISGNVAQAKLIGDLLSKKAKSEAIRNTAIVLSDENLLMPVLESIPEGIDQLNITMGYPLSNSIFYHFFESIAALHYKKTKNTIGGGFYYKDVLGLTEQLVFQLFGNNIIKEVNAIGDRIKKERLIYVPAEVFNELETAVGISFINLNKNNPATLIAVMQDFCKKVKISAYEKLNEIEKEFLYGFYKALNRIAELDAKQSALQSFETLLQLFRQILATESISFVGKPLEGLQLMGVLESRTLDFEHLILSSLNEGILPSGKTQNSFIPYDIKRKFELPSYKEKDAIFAYHFYRLLQRSKKIDLIYNSRADVLSGGERSRFIEQLINELPKANPNITLKHHTLSPAIPTGKSKAFSIPKTDEHLEMIKSHLKNGFSPSALNSFMMCPLNYYYRYILGMREEEIIEEQIEHSSFGSIIHNTLEDLYTPYVNTLLDLKSIAQMKSKVAEQLQKNYHSLLKIQPTKGNHRLAFEVAKRMVEDFLKTEESLLKAKNEIHLIGLEKKIEHQIDIKVDGQTTIPITIKGKIDRIDRLNGKLRIIDYKSGKVDSAKLTYKDSEALQKSDKGIARQILLYQMAYELESETSAEAGVISMQNINGGFLSLKTNSAKEDAEVLLKTVVANMLNKEKAFEHDEDSLYCTFC